MQRRTSFHQAENTSKKCMSFSFGSEPRMRSRPTSVQTPECELHDHDRSVGRQDPAATTSSLLTSYQTILKGPEGFTDGQGDNTASADNYNSFQRRDHANDASSASLCNGQAIKSCHSTGKIASIARISLGPASPMNQTYLKRVKKAK